MSERTALRDMIGSARRLVTEEAEALQSLAAMLDESFAKAVRLIESLEGRLIVTGLGKSGLIARKVAATLTSTGTPATFMHPVEAMHGDLGLVNADDALLAFSKSGNTDELVRFVLHFRRLGGAVVAATADRTSRLAELASIVIEMPDLPEAGPLNLAPTTSTSMMLALGDALAMALMEVRGLQPDDFAKLHPEGSLGKRLLLRARDLMHAGDELPVVGTDQSFADLLRTIDEKHLGLACIVDTEGKLSGVFTDGDLRRLIRRSKNPMKLSLGEALPLSRRDPGDSPVARSTVRADMPIMECRQIMRDSKITSLIVVDEQGKPQGIVRQHDIVAVGLG